MLFSIPTSTKNDSKSKVSTGLQEYYFFLQNLNSQKFILRIATGANECFKNSQSKIYFFCSRHDVEQLQGNCD